MGRKVSSDLLGRLNRQFMDRLGWVLLALYFAAGVAYSMALPAQARFPDETDYLTLAHHVAFGPGFSLDGVHPTALRAPGYPFFLAGIEVCGGGYRAIRICQFVLTCLTILLVHRLMGRPFAGVFLGTLLVACYPVLFYVSATLFPQTLAAFLLVLVLYLLQRKGKNALVDCLTGVSMGLLVLVAPTFLFAIAMALAGAVIFQVAKFRRMALIGSLAVVVIASWTVRNALVFHRFVPIASDSGLNLMMGNNPKASAMQTVDNPGAILYYNKVVDLGLDEFQSDKFYRDAALNWIKDHPGDAFVLYVEKVANYFNIVNVYAHVSRDEVPVWKEVVLAMSYSLLLALLGLRLFFDRQHPLIPMEKLLIAIYFLSAFSLAIFTTRIRYRLPYDFLIIAIETLYLSRNLKQWLGRGAAEPFGARSRGADSILS